MKICKAKEIKQKLKKLVMIFFVLDAVPIMEKSETFSSTFARMGDGGFEIGSIGLLVFSRSFEFNVNF